jgi:hypothetical protein
MKAEAFSIRPRGKLLDYGDRDWTTTTNAQQYADSFNTTTSTSDVTSDVGNTSVTLGKDGGGEWLDKLLPVVVIGALVIAGLTALRNR